MNKILCHVVFYGQFFLTLYNFTFPVKQSGRHGTNNRQTCLVFHKNQVIIIEQKRRYLR